MNLLIDHIRTCLGCGHCPGRLAMANAAAGTCPLGKFDGAPAPSPATDGGCCGDDAALWGPPLWAKIHARPLLPLDPHREIEFFRSEVPAEIRCCDCRAHYFEYARDHPVPVRDPDALRRWAVDLHNAVNARLGKPIFGSLFLS